ncbi:hypothetical protein LY622_13705 [Halomonas sp. M5N1S17]|uniref:hypothetical protein n=1 Tax=Halomonas alkalisoli TaxID=2907158 RepID=UPI001F161A15|nr:hypothetical protein [Halomonas alkalisoli]MCE9664489.1 hypothetical protein [Halomonas alkalisoli]
MIKPPTRQDPANFEASYERLRADLKAVRDTIGDTPMPSAGITAVDLLDKVLKRHPASPKEGQQS